MASRQLSCQISANKRKAETSANVNQHWKARAKGNDIITNVDLCQSSFHIDFFDADIPVIEM